MDHKIGKTSACEGKKLRVLIKRKPTFDFILFSSVLLSLLQYTHIHICLYAQW